MDDNATPVEDFDFDASTREAWELFSGRLAEVVSIIDPGGALTIGTLSSTTEPAPEIVFSCGDRTAKGEAPSIWAQASSNATLGEHFQLDVQQLDRLSDLGWQAPTTEGPHPTPNFWTTDEQDECTELADLAVATLRDVYGVQHPVFLAPDHLAEVLQPDVAPTEDVASPGGLLDAHDAVAVMPASRSELDALINTELTHMFGHEPIRDSEGDIAIRVGSTMVFVRSAPDAREILLFSALVHEVEGRSRAMEVLNDLNTESRYGRFSLFKDRVFVTMSLLTRPFVPAHLHEGVRIMSQIADGIDDDLAAKLRGRTTFTDDE